MAGQILENISYEHRVKDARAPYWQAAMRPDEDLRSALEYSPDGIIVICHDDTVKFVNESFTLLTGIKKEQILSQDQQVLNDILTRLSSRVIEKGRVGLLYKLRQDNFNNPHKFYRRKTDRVNQLFTETPEFRVLQKIVRHPSDGAVKEIIYYRDITHDYHSNVTKSEHLLAAAHELRNLIGNILGFSEILKTKLCAQDENAFLVEASHSQSGFLNQVLKDLLSLNQFEINAGSEVELQKVELNTEVRKMTDYYFPPANRPPIEFIPATRRIEVVMDVNKFKQARYNLISNAYKYSSGRVIVKVNAPSAEHEVAITVIDYGIGITCEQQKHLFKKYWRAKADQAIEGSGLGLVLVKEIVELFNGRVEISSEKDKGTAATIFLPRQLS